MPWYAVHDATGRLVSLGTVLTDPLPANLSAVELAGEPDPTAQQWDADRRAFVPRPPAPRWVDPYDFMRRFTIAEEAAIRGAARTDPVIEVLLARLAAPTLTRVLFDDQTLLDGLAYLQSKSLLTPERALELLQ